MHGAMGHDVMEGTAEALRAVSVFLARRGVTQYLPTTVTASVEFTLKALDGIARCIESDAGADEAKPVGMSSGKDRLFPMRNGGCIRRSLLWLRVWSC